MRRSEQKALFMSFYGVTPELRDWAKLKWESGTQSLTPESLEYMKNEITDREKRKLEAERIAAEIEKEGNPDGTTRTDAEAVALAEPASPVAERE